MTEVERARRVLNMIRAKYEGDGYAFFERPARNLLPPFMKGYVPDAIALGPKKNIAIEMVLRGRDEADENGLPSISQRFDGQQDWQLVAIYAAEQELDEFTPELATDDVIARQIDEAVSLSVAGHERAAFLLAWATLEAIAVSARSALGESRSTRRPRQVLDTLESLGKLSFEQTTKLRELVNVRNAVVHGDYGRQVQKSDVDEVISASRAALVAA